MQVMSDRKLLSAIADSAVNAVLLVEESFFVLAILDTMREYKQMFLLKEILASQVLER